MNTLRLIHVIFKTHLDIGFTGLASDVTAQYMTRFIPAALDRADEMRRAGNDRFVWTTGSWLIDEYLATSSNADRERMEWAIVRGDIAWHALPFTFPAEGSTPDLYRAALQISKDLDARFGRETIAAKQTDVPGHTRSIIPYLREFDVRFLHIGINGGSTPPRVPPVFRWRHPQGDEVLVMQHSGYGDLMLVPGLDEAIYFAHTNDNLGPQTAGQIQELFNSLRARFPGAEVRGSTMDAFALALERVRSDLPVVTQEIGDTWVHGLASDPLRLSWYRELLRLREGWIRDGRLDQESKSCKLFSRQLLLTIEHTWGLDFKTFFAGEPDYTNEALARLRAAGRTANLEKSWAEQRGYVQTAWMDLENRELAEEARERLASLRPERPNPADPAQGWQRTDPYLPFGEGRFTFGFNAEGALAWYEDRAAKRHWLTPDHTLGPFTYQTFSALDYERFFRQYIVNKEETAGWARLDFTKPGLEKEPLLSRIWKPKLERLYQRMGQKSQQFLLYLLFPAQAVDEYGAPGVAWQEWDIPHESSDLSLTLQWFDKTATRRPEAAWFTVNPNLRGGNWEMDKLGGWVDPLDVVEDGNRHLHAVNSGVRWRKGKEAAMVESLDAPLVAPGRGSLLDFNNRQPRMSLGMDFLLLNNVWGTNFTMWFDEDVRFRFRFRFE